jgi:hypothetical protein
VRPGGLRCGAGNHTCRPSFEAPDDAILALTNGAASDHYMTHLPVTEAPGDERPEADWGEHVTDDEYHGR